MFYNTYYNKLVAKGVRILETFQKWIFEVLELIFHVISIVSKGVPFEGVLLFSTCVIPLQ
ncbi:hypothetical protein CN535_26605 [Bacillus pseudomycoides]|nr:hypothetical protein bpmyx0001_57950 [Bacillus pseudomycoides DSM 12442]OOR48611.1 hypothetical protein BLX05_28560 [Bacillus pseudomycoides]PDY08174.1 hypothetical protein COO16_30420 [Bacillus pseudomycoides]PEU33618.1 hypothetical protein CN535_26605 [Bacillus pseudomycoides]PFY12854.1 hypothetical protein COL42_23050 [Bacillus pseudomycoides]